MKKNGNDEICCGSCVHFKYECADGSGWCEQSRRLRFCGYGKDCKMYESEEKVRRHYIAVLIQANRWRRDNNVPSIYKMPNPKEVGRAIDFAINYLKGD